MTSVAQNTLDKCESSWDEELIKGVKNKDNCSGFVKAVAKKLGIVLPETANADGIVDAISKGWKTLDSGSDAAKEAAVRSLVLAGLKAADHKPARNNGHIAIVVAGELYRKKYPLVWCGSLGAAKSKGDKSVGEVWSVSDRDSVAYYVYVNPDPKK